MVVRNKNLTGGSLSETGVLKFRSISAHSQSRLDLGEGLQVAGARTCQGLREVPYLLPSAASESLRRLPDSAHIWDVPIQPLLTLGRAGYSLPSQPHSPAFSICSVPWEAEFYTLHQPGSWVGSWLGSAMDVWARRAMLICLGLASSPPCSGVVRA